MKSSIKKILTVSLLSIAILIPSDSYAKGGEGLRKFLKGCAKVFGGAFEAGVSALCQQSCYRAGYSQEESITMTQNALEAIGLNRQNIDRGINYVNAQNKYDRQNIAKDYAFDMAGEFVSNAEMLNAFRGLTDAQLTCLSERSQATTDEERAAAFDKRNQRYADILYDEYQLNKDRYEAHQKEKAKITNELVKCGYDKDLARELSSSVLAIQKSDMSEEEKEQTLRDFGLTQNTSRIIAIADEIVNNESNTSQAEEQELLGKEKIEKERIEREQVEAERRAEEKKQDIEKMIHVTINKYKFDEVELSESQKQELVEVAKTMNKYNDISIILTGHACNIGYENINYKKGLQRANIAKEYLIQNGVSEDRMQVDSKGELEPIDNSNTPEGRAKNRRVEISIAK